MFSAALIYSYHYRVSVDILDQMMSQSCLYRLLDTHSGTLQCLASGCYNTIRII